MSFLFVLEAARMSDFIDVRHVSQLQFSIALEKKRTTLFGTLGMAPSHSKSAYKSQPANR